MRNSSFLFIPFCFDRGVSFDALTDEISGSGHFVRTADKNVYMFKYVFDKMNSDISHFTLTASGMEKFGIPVGKKCSFTAKGCEYGFTLADVHLFIFNTAVGIAAFRVVFDKSDAHYIACAQYNMKKSTFEINAEQSFTFDQMTRNMLSGFSDCSDNLFFYAEKDKGRAYFLTYLEVQGKDSYDSELYSLRECYDGGFEYCEEVEPYCSETFRVAHDRIWGVSSTASVCLGLLDRDKNGFLKESFLSNFNTYYFTMFVLLLHRRYVMYRFLTDISSKESGLTELENYKSRLADFENKFIFEQITDVPQYQQLYEKVEKAFSLKALYEDVLEPIQMLTDQKERDEERKEKIKENRINSAITMLSLLAIISAITDSHGFISEMWKRFPLWANILLIVGATGLITYVTINYIISHVQNKNDEKKKH